MSKKALTHDQIQKIESDFLETHGVGVGIRYAKGWFFVGLEGSSLSVPHRPHKVRAMIEEKRNAAGMTRVG